MDWDLPIQYSAKICSMYDNDRLAESWMLAQYYLEKEGTQMKQVSNTATLPKNPGSQPSRWPKFNFSPRRGGTETINVANLDRPICQKDPMLGNYASVPIALKQILVPTDLKEESQKAVSYGLVLAHSFTAHLTLLHVYREPYSVDYLRGPQACAAVSRLRRDSEIALATLLQQVAEQYADCSAEFRYGSVCEEIVKSAREREIDLIVVSTHHFGWLMRLAYGCDAEQILRRAPCPILIV
jgi:nucleotide-binding universal stress UspA family protein